MPLSLHLVSSFIDVLDICVLTVPPPGTNTIILTPLGQPGLSSTIFSLPTSSTPSITATPLVQLATKTEEPVVVIKSEPDMSIVEMEEEQEQVQVKQEDQERDPTTTCCAALVTEGPCSLRLPQAPSGPCSQELIDLNSLTQVLVSIIIVFNNRSLIMIFILKPQMLDLVTMEPKLAGELTAAEKYIIKSRLRWASEFQTWHSSTSIKMSSKQPLEMLYQQSVNPCLKVVFTIDEPPLQDPLLEGGGDAQLHLLRPQAGHRAGGRNAGDY